MSLTKPSKCKKKHFIVSLLLFILLVCCQKKPAPTINFYYWKTQFQLNTQETEYLKNLQSKRLYLRLFDVDFHPEKGAIPLGNTQVLDSTHLVQFVGVVFITNRTMLQIKPSALPDLAEKITKKIFHKTLKIPLVGIQLDCDWSEKSKKNFFKLCSLIKKICKEKNLELSATIRLHQFKYKEQTGIPPVDRGVLMLYNVGDIEGKNTENSILEQKIIDSYLKDAEKYPLPMAVALPLFHWAVVKRLGKVVNLLSQIEKADLSLNKNLKKIQKNIYSVKINHYFAGTYLYEGDEIRWEEVTWESLAKLSSSLTKKINTQEIIFYHLDTKIIKDYPYEKLKNLAYY
ncbi:MAG: hypothetical protein OHK0045_07270 [Raineya sp.]